MREDELVDILKRHSDIVKNRIQRLSCSQEDHVVLSVSNEIRFPFDEAYGKANIEIEHAILSSGKYENDYRYNFPIDFFYKGKIGWKQYGLFSYIPLYKETRWTYEIIEKYKDKLVWVLLFEYGDIVFPESILRKYDRFIPWVDSEASNESEKHRPFLNYVAYNWQGTSVSNFERIGKLSSAFILSHIKEIDYMSLLKNGEFEMTKELFEHFYRGIKIKEKSHHIIKIIEYVVNNQRITISSEVVWFIATILKAPKWEELLIKLDLSPEWLSKFYEYNHNSLNVLFKCNFKKRRYYVSMITQDENLLNLFGWDYVKQLYQGGNKWSLKNNTGLYYGWTSESWNSSDQYDAERHGFVGFKYVPYTYDFSVELIKANYDLWNMQAYDYFSHMHRTPDVNYHRYKKVTTWDLLSKQESLLLTYEISKYLLSIEVMVGGSYTLEDGDYYSEGTPNYYVNGLKSFCDRAVKDEVELKKIIDDKDLVSFCFEQAHGYFCSLIISEVINNYLNNYSLKDLLSLIEQ